MQRQFRCLAIGFENNNAYEHSRSTFIKNALRQSVALPLVGVTAKVPLEVRVEGLEPYINDQLNPSILFNPGLTLLMSELETWPEPQTGHHYDGLSALQLLWMIAVSRGAGSFAWEPIPRRETSRYGGDHFLDDDDEPDYGGRGLW
jgi:hypothetical protein